MPTKLPTSWLDGKAGSQSQVQHIFDWLIIDHQGRACDSKNILEEELSTLVQMVEKFKPAERDQWNKLGVQLCVQADTDPWNGS